MKNDFTTKNLNYSHKVIEKPIAINHIMHSHEDEYQLLLVFAGNLSYHIEDTTYYLQPPCAVLIRPKQSHYPFFLDNVTAYHSATFNIKTYRQNSALLTKLEKAFSSTIFTLLTPSVVLNILQQIDQYLDLFSENFIAKILPLKLNELICVFTESVQPASCASSDKYTLFYDIINFIERNRYTLKTAHEICEEFKISKSKLYLLFQKELKTSPMKFVVNCRLGDAHKLIKSGRRPSAVFFLCGFPDYPNFYRLYKKKYKVSPSETYKISLKEPTD